MEQRLVIVDGYNLIHRSPQLAPGPQRTLAESRDKLVNLLSWTVGAGARFLIVFDGEDGGAGGEKQGRVETRFSRPPETADDVIRRVVEKEMGDHDDVTVVTADIEVARHARAMGATVSLSDLFLASVLAPPSAGDAADAAPAEKPVQLSKKEIEEWAEIFKRQGPRPDPLDE